MSSFTDTLMLRLNAPGGVQDVLFPLDGQGTDRVRQLVGILYGLPASSVHEVLKIELVSARFQRPLFRQRLFDGTWIRTSPDHARTDVHYEGRQSDAPPEWIDLSARLAVTLLLELEKGKIESITFGDVEESEEADHRLLGEIKLVEPPPFDPADPANRRRLSLELALLMREAVDITDALRASWLIRDLAERGLAGDGDADGLEARCPLAPVLVFPQAAVDASGFSEADLLAFFAGQDILAISMPP